MEMKQAFIPLLITSYFISLGVIIGGSIIGSLGSFLVGAPPLYWMARFAENLRIWAIVAAMGGTFDAVYEFERGIFSGDTRAIIRQIIIIVVAMAGAQTGALILRWIVQEN